MIGSIGIVDNLEVVSRSLVDIAEIPFENVTPAHAQALALQASLDCKGLVTKDLDALSVVKPNHAYSNGIGLIGERLSLSCSELETCLGAMQRLYYYMNSLPDQTQRNIGRAVRPVVRAALDFVTVVGVIRLEGTDPYAYVRSVDEQNHHMRAHANSYMTLRPIMNHKQRIRILGSLSQEPAVVNLLPWTRLYYNFRGSE